MITSRSHTMHHGWWLVWDDAIILYHLGVMITNRSHTSDASLVMARLRWCHHVVTAMVCLSKSNQLNGAMISCSRGSEIAQFSLATPAIFCKLSEWWYTDGLQTDRIRCMHHHGWGFDAIFCKLSQMLSPSRIVQHATTECATWIVKTTW